ncbi:hypothetical protein SLEP1_g47333 [Rubroshorea leprosula]|uniref:Uncharacterized protein n=1 Tax=Rubroshorea leprosula TaxID=152421 RepID=A0AAV5LQ53_9ROSI|nr:hypothetical protein SLEP1_g47333 [Rubroshorea leprosula]
MMGRAISSKLQANPSLLQLRVHLNLLGGPLNLECLIEGWFRLLAFSQVIVSL